MAEAAQSLVLPRAARSIPAVAALTALGIVYGDIGTSPLYAFKQAAQVGGAPSPDTVLGVLSVIVWSLVLIVSLKYAILILRADNHGEGGIVALLALLDARNAPARVTADRRLGRLGAVVWRWGYHPSYFGAQRGRRTEGRCPATRAGRRSSDRGDSDRTVPRPAAGDRVRRQHLRAGDAGMVLCDRPSRTSRDSAGA